MKKDNSIESRKVLLKFATLLGQMHAATLGKAQDFEQIQNKLHPDLVVESGKVQKRRAEYEKHVQTSLELLDLELSSSTRRNCTCPS
mmetsp:Transcript_22138/g.61525  ORF Transcript_22138/g.61525 Transcript_22138/m.61525 type:complete len:87 (-) Transcript_22138:142-402(-)